MDYPAELMYNNINPKGFFSTFKEWTIEPTGSAGQFYGGENVKILIQSIVSGVMDPYRSHLEITVETKLAELPVGLLQIDSSAQSFIEQLVISSRNKEIERIPEYSVLAAWLTDIGLAEMYAEGRETEGLGYTNVDSFHFASKQQLTQTSTFFPSTSTGATGIEVRSNGNIFPTQTSTVNNYDYISSGSWNMTQPVWTTSKRAHGHITPSNLAWLDQLEPTWYSSRATTPYTSARTASLKESGYLQNLRAEYTHSIQNTKYCDSTTSRPTNHINLRPGLLIGVNNTVEDFDYADGEYYSVEIPNSYTYRFPLNNTTMYVDDIENTTANVGFTSLYSPNFCKGTNEPFISATVPQCQMQNGKILPAKVPISKKTFKIPLISAILGLLIPEDQFVLLPIKGLNDILMEFVLDKYAMFTSGYNDICELDKTGVQTKYMQKRAFQVSRIEYKMHTYQFFDAQIDKYLSQSLTNRILLNVNMWTLGNQYTIAKGDHVSNNWPVACTSEALNEIVVLFVPSDYYKYTFCRKHFRISNNITKFQLRVNMEYFPPQPILGNGGNPCQIENYDDNSNFIESIFWSNNFMFNKVNPMPRINAYNFAINERIYNIDKVGPMYRNTSGTITENIKDNAAFKWKTQSTVDPVNVDTALGMPWIHENRYVGKAGYVYSFEPYAHSAYHMTGIDCRNIRQFDVLLNAETTNAFPREQQMYIFTRSSVVIEFTDLGINVYGK